MSKDWTISELNQRPGKADNKVMGAPNLLKDFKPDFAANRQDMGRADTLRFNVLTYVVEENYDRAIHEMKIFLNRDFDYPKFRERIERYIEHAIDLVNAIRAKRNFPGAQMLTMAKQQELNEKFVAHFSELQSILKKIERIQQDVRIEDVRSTVWIVKAAVNAVFAVAVVAFLLDVNAGLLKTTILVIDDVFHEMTAWFFSKL
ncbi:MAG: hypothetical protein ACAH59_05835 [Pseudobdellovibrionaceae bacterium]